MEMKKIVVTGGAGFIGSHVAEYYATRGLQVTVVDNMSRARLLGLGDGRELDNASYLESLPNVEVLRADVRDFDTMCRLVSDTDAIVHAAAQTAVTTSMVDPLEDFSVNAQGTICVLEAARRTGRLPAVVFTSTNKVYGKRVNGLGVTEVGESRYAFHGRYARGVPEVLGVDLCEHTPYGCSKLSGDLYAQDYALLYGLKVGVFRMSCIYGPRQFGLEDQGWLAWFVIAACLGRPITLYGDGRQVRDVLYVTDLVRAFDAFIQSSERFGVFNTGGGPDNTLSLLELLQLISEMTGKSPEVRFAEWRPSDQKVYVSDITKLRDTLKWRPKVGIREGLSHVIDWVAANKDRLAELI